MNLFTCGEEISKLAVYSSKNYYSFLSAANLSFFQNIFKICSLKIGPSKSLLSKLLPQKIDLTKLLPLKIHFKKLHWRELAKSKNQKFLFFIFYFFAFIVC